MRDTGVFWENIGERMASCFMRPYPYFLFIVLSFAMFVLLFQIFWEQQSGQIFGKVDITNYYQMNKMNENDYLSDKNHWATLNIMHTLGYPLGTTLIFYVFTPLVMYWMYRGVFDELKSCIASLMSIFFTSYMAHVTYVGVLSQSISFMFFCVMLGYYMRGRFPEMLYFSIIGIWFHYVSMFAYAIFFLLAGFNKWDKNTLYTGLLMIFLLTLYVVPFDFGGPIKSSGINLSETNIMSSKLDTEPKIWYIVLNLNNPILLASTRCMNAYYIIYMLLGLLVHNGRMTMFFIPFMVGGALKDKNNKQMLWIAILSLFWMIDFQMNFLGQTITYLKEANLFNV